jgi:hypothetical protein
LALTTLSALAQDEELPEGCDVAGAVTVIAELVADTQLEPLAILQAVKEAVDEALSSCSDHVYTSEEEGRQPVLGPIELEAGLWRVTLDTTGYFIAHLTVLEGACETKGFGSMYNISQGQGVNAQTLIESEGCEALFEISNVSADWTLTFEQLR